MLLGLVVQGAVGRFGRMRTQRLVLLGVPICQVAISLRKGKLLSRQCRRAAELLAGAGAKTVLLPPDLGRQSIWKKRGLTVAEEFPLRQALAADLCRQVLWKMEEEPGRTTVLLSAQRVTPAVEQTALSLCNSVRYLCLQTGVGSEALARMMQRQYGLAASGIGQARLGLCFDPPLQTPAARQILRLYPGAEREQPILWQLPENIPVQLVRQLDAGALLCALWQAGALSCKQIRWQLPCKEWQEALDKPVENDYNTNR